MMAEESLSGRTRRDWTARTRSTTFDALRYTKFVVRMKRVLSLSAFAVICAVMGFFFVQRAPRSTTLTYQRLGSIQNDRAMIKPRLSGTDAQGNPFVVTADIMVQDANNPKRAKFQTVEADLTNKQGWFNARANNGSIDMEVGRLVLIGDIQAFSDSGYQLRTPSALINLKTNIVSGEQQVQGQGPLGTMRADRFRYDRDADLLTLIGHVHVTMTGKIK
jgi:lipopolysaccharide export system protein LptC